MSQPSHLESPSAPVEFDDVFKMINSFGTYQKTLFFSCCLLMFCYAFPFGLLVFGFATPPFQCSTPNITCPQSTCCDNCTSYSFDKSFTSTVTEWNLICGRASLKAAIQTCMFAGMLFGAPISGMVSDAFGRKKGLFIFTGIMIVGGFSSAFSNSVPLMAFLWFVLGFGRPGLDLCLFTNVMEMVGPHTRTMAAVVLDISYIVATLIIALLAYFIRDWRILFMVGTVPGVLLYVFWMVFPESPRWLVAHDQLEEALFILLKYGGKKNKAVDQERLKYLIVQVRRNQVEKQRETIPSDPRMLCRTPKLRKWTGALGFNWFSTAFIGNALFLYITSLSGSIYLNVAIKMVIGLTVLPIMWLVLKMFGRRIPNTVVMFLVGILCLLVLAIPSKYPMVKSRLFLAASGISGGLWTVMAIRTVETYPTVVRTTAQGTGSMIGRVGAMIAPFIAILDRIPGIGVTVPVVIFGVISLAAGVISLFIPETLFAPMHQTIEEAEAATEDYGIPCCGRPRNKPRGNAEVEAYQRSTNSFDTHL